MPINIMEWLIFHSHAIESNQICCPTKCVAMCVICVHNFAPDKCNFYDILHTYNWQHYHQHMFIEICFWDDAEGRSTMERNPPFTSEASLIARFMWPTWGPPNDDSILVGPMLAPWTLLSGMLPGGHCWDYFSCALLLPLNHCHSFKTGYP